MERRDFLAVLAASVGAALTACTASPEGLPPSVPGASPTPSVLPTSVTTAQNPLDRPLPGRVFSAPDGIVQVPVPKGVLSALPGSGNAIALTVDDGTDQRVVQAYATLAQITGLRLTFFVNGENPGWTQHAPILRPLVEARQVWMANHTWSHPDLTRLSSTQLAKEVTQNEDFLKKTYGVTGRPFLRPPFGYRNAKVDAQLAALGYPAVTMWLGSLADSSTLAPAAIVDMAEKWFRPQSIVIGHANHPPVIEIMGRLVEIIRQRNLTPVHLGDIYATRGVEIPNSATIGSARPSTRSATPSARTPSPTPRRTP